MISLVFAGTAQSGAKQEIRVGNAERSHWLKPQLDRAAISTSKSTDRFE